jgi:hypothetical protein
VHRWVLESARSWVNPTAHRWVLRSGLSWAKLSARQSACSLVQSSVQP